MFRKFAAALAVSAMLAVPAAIVFAPMNAYALSPQLQTALSQVQSNPVGLAIVAANMARTYPDLADEIAKAAASLNSGAAAAIAQAVAEAVPSAAASIAKAVTEAAPGAAASIAKAVTEAVPGSAAAIAKAVTEAAPSAAAAIAKAVVEAAPDAAQEISDAVIEAAPTLTADIVTAVAEATGGGISNQKQNQDQQRQIGNPPGSGSPS